MLDEKAVKKKKRKPKLADDGTGGGDIMKGGASMASMGGMA